MSVNIDAEPLRGDLVRLEPLTEDHVPGLALAAEEDRSAYTYTMVPRAAETAAYVKAQLTRDEVTPFAQVRVADGAPVGCTAYSNPRAWPGRDDLSAVEIGGTWLAASAQRTGINAESKLLLMTYAFETLNVVRVDFRTDARNRPSRQAIERLGARFEGVLRNWGPSWAPGEEGRLRDSAIFSVIAVEWPQVKSALTRRIQGLCHRKRGVSRGDEDAEEVARRICVDTERLVPVSRAVMPHGRAQAQRAVVLAVKLALVGDDDVQVHLLCR